MKQDQRTLEIMCLSSITKSVRCMDKALTGHLTKDHFVHMEPNDKYSYTSKLFEWMHLMRLPMQECHCYYIGLDLWWYNLH